MKRFLIVLISIFFGCTEYTKDNISHETEPEDTLTLKIDSLTSFNNKFYDLVCFDNREHLGFINELDNTIRLYDLEEQKETYKILVPSNGENGMPKPDGFIFVNKDSIFVIGEYAQDVKLFNINGELIKDYEFQNPKEDKLYGFGRRQISTSNKPIYHKNKIYICGFPEFDLGDPYALFERVPIELCLDINSENYYYPKDIKFPDSYKDKLYNINFSRVFNPHHNSAVYNFAADNYLYEIDLNNPQPIKIDAKSEFIKKIKPRSVNDNFQQYMIEEPFYYSILYNEYTKHYYRFVYHRNEINNDKGELNDYSNGQYSIITLDSAYNKINEIKLERNTYDLNTYFINSDGLYISTSNPNNQNINEDELTFHLFKI